MFFNKKNCKRRRSESETESVTEIVEKWVDDAWLLWWPERLGYWIRKRSFISWLKAQWKTQSDYVYCPVVWKVLHHAFYDCLLQNFNWFVQSIKVLYQCEFTTYFTTGKMNGCFGNSAYGILIRLFLEFVVEFITCGETNGCFGTGALYTSEDNVNLQLHTHFSRSNHNGTK